METSYGWNWSKISMIDSRSLTLKFYLKLFHAVFHALAVENCEIMRFILYEVNPKQLKEANRKCKAVELGEWNLHSQITNHSPFVLFNLLVFLLVAFRFPAIPSLIYCNAAYISYLCLPLLNFWCVFLSRFLHWVGLVVRSFDLIIKTQFEESIVKNDVQWSFYVNCFKLLLKTQLLTVFMFVVIIILLF